MKLVFGKKFLYFIFEKISFYLFLDIFGFKLVLNDGIFGSLQYLLDLSVDIDVFEIEFDGKLMRIDIC